MSEKLDYFRDRLVNAWWMLRRGQWRLMATRFAMELNLRRHHVLDYVRGQRGIGHGGRPGSSFTNLRRVQPPSFRPAAEPGKPVRTTPVDPSLAQTLQRILDQLDVEAVCKRAPSTAQAPEDAELRYNSARDALLSVARRAPLDLPDSAANSHFITAGEYDNLYRVLLQATRRVCDEQPTQLAKQLLGELATALPPLLGGIASHNFFSQLQLLLGLRRLRLGIYDHAGHFAGGGQRYIAELAALVQDRYDITFLANRPLRLPQYREWYDLDLSSCDTRVIELPFFAERNIETPNESMVLGLRDNVFDAVARETLHYDIFINANMLGKVNPLALQSVFICHFPDKDRDRFFQVHNYDRLIVSGEYSREWVRRRWQLEPTDRLYPAVSMENPDSSASDKDRVILSVSRFENSGSKKQLELIRAFRQLSEQHPSASAGWKLVLAGGSTPDNRYLTQVQAEAREANCAVEIVANASVADIRRLYSRASIFWHACGLKEKQPERIEHFGMTTVEAMQNYCVPIVIDGGGQREIVTHGEAGYRFGSIDELIDYSAQVMADPALRNSLATAAYQRSKLFGLDVFAENAMRILTELENELLVPA